MVHKYKLKYNVEHESGLFEGDDIKREGKGGCDAFVFASLIYPEDGSFSLNWSSFDGRNMGQPLTDKEMFKVWLLIGARLAERGELDNVKSLIAVTPVKMARELIFDGKTVGDKENLN